MTYANPVFEATSVRSDIELIIKYSGLKGQEKKKFNVQCSTFNVKG